MEDDLKNFKMEDDLKNFKMEYDVINVKMEDDLKNFKMQDDLKNFKMEDDTTATTPQTKVLLKFFLFFLILKFSGISHSILSQVET